MKEEFRPVVGNDNYMISNHGRVYSLATLKWGGPRVGYYMKPAQFLKPGRASHGYLTVVLRPGGTRTVHSLVAEAFLGPRPEGQEVRHKDDDRGNPRLDNLCYGTRKENMQDMISRGRSGDRIAAAAKARETMLSRYGPDHDKLRNQKSRESKLRNDPDADRKIGLKVARIRLERYGPGHTRLGFAGIKYSKMKGGE